MACIDKTTTQPSRKGHKLTQLFAHFVIYILNFIATVGSNFLHVSQISAQSPKVHSKTGLILNIRFSTKSLPPRIMNLKDKNTAKPQTKTKTPLDPAFQAKRKPSSSGKLYPLSPVALAQPLYIYKATREHPWWR